MAKQHLPQHVGTDQPSWLTEIAAKDTSLENLKQYRRLPILKVIQALSPDELKDAFGEGTCVLLPQKIEICKKDGGFNFIPCAQFTEFVQWADRKDTSSPAVLDSSRNPQSQIALKAKSREGRRGTYNNGSFECTYAEHINFLGVIVRDDGTFEQCGLSFSKGEFFRGAEWAGKIVDKGLPLWSGIWNFTIGKHENKQKQKWWGFDITFNQVIKENQSKTLMELSQELFAGIAKQELGVDLEAEGNSESAKADPEFGG